MEFNLFGQKRKIQLVSLGSVPGFIVGSLVGAVVGVLLG